MEGYVYILVNSSLPNLVKIGRTTKEPNIRAAELSSTGTPGRFIVAYSVLVDNCVEIESEMHSIFSKQRHTNDREFFDLDSPTAIDKLNEITKDRKVSVLVNPETNVQSRVATFYLIKVHKQKNMYRIGLINKEKAYLTTDDFKGMVIELYQHYVADNFYDCEIIEFIEFSFVDEKAIDDMKSIIDNNIVRLKSKNKSIFDVSRTGSGSYDVRTLVLNWTTLTDFHKQVYSSTLSLIEPLAKASLNRNLNKIASVNELDNKKILKDKLQQIDAIKKLGI